MSILLVGILLIVSLNNNVLSTDKYYDDSSGGKMVFSFNFDSPTYSIVNINNNLYNRVHLNGLPVSEKIGEPKLPVKPIRILLPYSTVVEKINIETSEEKIVENFEEYDIELGGLSRSFNSNDYNKIIPNYKKNLVYPDKLFNDLGVQCLNGYMILYVNIHPVRYLGSTNTLYYNDEITISVETKDQTNSDYLQKFDERQKIMDLVINPEVINSYPDEGNTCSFGSNIYDYVIITTEDLKNSSGEYTFYDLISQREDQGLSCTIKTVEEIKQEYPGVDTQEKIRNFIKDAYSNWDTKWVLLGGDVEYVPIRLLYDIDGFEKDETHITSDVYYQCLDGDYNYDGDGDWGEEFDGVNGKTIDLLAEVYVGRAPVDDSLDLSSFVEKTLSYENSDWDEDEYLRNVLSAGEDLWTGPGGDGSGYVELCIDYQTDYDMDTYGIPSDIYDITKLYEVNQVWSDDDVINVIDNGVSIINHVGHGTSVAAMKLSRSEIDDLSNIGKYCLFYTQACHSGQLEKHDECFAERWVNAPRKGGFAAIMDTGYGYGSTNSYDGADNRYAREFFDALYSPSERISRIGEANQDSKEDNIWHIDERNMYHAYYNTILLGDPYVSIKGAEEANARFTFDPLYPKTNEIIHFEDKSLGIITYRQWSFGDGQVSSQKNPTHVYGSEGTYKVTLTVQDNQGYHSTVTESIMVKHQWDPIAKITPESYNGFNFKLDFSAASSWDPDGEITSYHWDFDDGSTSDIIEPEHIYQEEGTYHVELLVEDDDGNVDREFSTIVLSMQESPDIPSFLNSPSLAFTGDKIMLSFVSFDPEGNDIQYGIDTDDGDDIKWTDWYSSGENCSFSYVYDSVGSFNVRVKARDENYGESNWSESILITITDEKAPFLDIIKPTKGIYISNEKKLAFPTSIVFGEIDIVVNATDASGIEKVIYYVDDFNQPVAEVLSQPYVFSWKDKSFFRHNIKIVAIDDVGKESTFEMKIWKFF